MTHKDEYVSSCKSGYTHCACRDCFDITVSADMAKPELCWACEEAGCDEQGEHECRRDDAYEDYEGWEE